MQWHRPHRAANLRAIGDRSRAPRGSSARADAASLRSERIDIVSEA